MLSPLKFAAFLFSGAAVSGTAAAYAIYVVFPTLLAAGFMIREVMVRPKSQRRSSRRLGNAWPSSAKEISHYTRRRNELLHHRRR